MKPMGRIITYSNWCYIDRLDGIDLKDGERLWVKFPNGERIQITCSIHASKQVVLDMGRPYEMPVRRAYLKTKWKGQQCMVELVGLEAERV